MTEVEGNIYQFFWPENTDWVYALKKKQAIRFHQNLTGISDWDYKDCKITRVKKSNWVKCNIIDPDTGKVENTFADWVKDHGGIKADMICTTAY